jgi:hypothetical protein
MFSEIEVTGSSGPGVSDIITVDKTTGYYGGSLVVETVERQTFQSGSELATFETFTGYAPPGGGYGDTTDPTLPALVTQVIENETT